MHVSYIMGSIYVVRRGIPTFLVKNSNTHREIFFFCLFFSSHFYFPASGQAVLPGVVPSPPRFLPSIFIAHRVQQSHCSSIFHRVLLTHALAISVSQFEHKKESQRIYTSMHSTGLELTKLTYTRLEDNLIRHRRDRLRMWWVGGPTSRTKVDKINHCTAGRRIRTLRFGYDALHHVWIKSC